MRRYQSIVAGTVLGVAGLALVGVCRHRALDRSAQPLFGGLGKYSRPISTKDVLAQRYWDQGLSFLYSFNHEEARRSFEAAALADPKSAIAEWGIAMACGPDINHVVVSPVRAAAGWKAVERGLVLAPAATPVERALIQAVSRRYSANPLMDRKRLDVEYADAMQKVWEAFPSDADVGALTAEALLDLRPWNQWSPDGKPESGTEELLEILRSVLDRAPSHPFALHLMIHAVEQSSHPAMGENAADRLRDLMPGSDHMLHMPSHIYVQVGRWHDAVLANEKAIAADRTYRRSITHADPYEFARVHNGHMLVFAAMMEGNRRKAEAAITNLLSDIPESYIADRAETVDGLFGMPFEVHLRFGNWNLILVEPEPRECFPTARALWHFARGIAFAAKKQVIAARVEQAEFLSAQRTMPKNVCFGPVRAETLLAVAERMLAGEILYREGNAEGAITALREAVECEDRLPWTEPPIWIVPVRHALGATLLDAGRYHEAEDVYRQDLRHHPENGWSLFGIAQCLRLQGKRPDAEVVAARFERAWKFADVKLSSSCFCLQAGARR